MEKRTFKKPESLPVKLYKHYLADAFGRGAIDAEDYNFWISYAKKAKKRKGYYSPFTYLYRSTYRTGLSRQSFNRRGYAPSV